MDTEEDIKIKQGIQKGHPETDEGPYYHESWWESYKGSVKGKLGGAVIGAAVGAAIGIAAAGVLAALTIGGLTFAAGAAIAGGFAAAGMLYGGHEFSEIGKVTGAVAAAHEKSEHRQNARFSKLEKGLAELKAMLGKKTPANEASDTSRQDDKTEAKPETGHSRDYRTQHCDDHCPPKGRKWVFWKIAAIGLAIGLAAGALLAFGGLAGHVLHALGAVAPEAIAHAGIGTYAASMTTMGLFGASFGINRDIFRQVFDNTDLWFRGMFSRSKERGKEVDSAHAAAKPVEKADHAITTIVYDTYADYPQSDTYHRDKVLSSAKQALLSMDHTKAVPH